MLKTYLLILGILGTYALHICHVLCILLVWCTNAGTGYHGYGITCLSGEKLDTKTKDPTQTTSTTHSSRRSMWLKQGCGCGRHITNPIPMHNIYSGTFRTGIRAWLGQTYRSETPSKCTAFRSRFPLKICSPAGTQTVA
jgi:hypothetical protein